MVVQRTLDKIEEIKARPHHERKAVAMWWAVSVTVLLLLFWGFFAVRNIGKTAAQLSQDQENAAGAVQAASVAASTDTSLEMQPSGYSATSSNGHVELVPPPQTGL